MKGKLGPDNKMHNTNNKCTDDVAVARPVENTKECATSLDVAVNKKGSQVHKSLSTDNRDKPPSYSAIARPQTSGHKKKAGKKDKHSTDSAIVPTNGKGDEGSNDGDNPTSSSQVVLYASRVEECAVDTALEETSKGRTKRNLPSKDSEKEALPAKRRMMVKSNNMLPSKDSEAASDKDHLMCQMSIQTIIDAADQLKRIPELIKSVRDAGFGHFIDTKIKGSINRKGMSYILKHIDIPTMTVKFSEEKKIEINRYAIHHLYGIPNGHLSAPRPNENIEVLPELKQELGFRSDEDITARKLVEMLRFMVNEHLESNDVINRDLALKLFYLILFNKGLCVGIAPRISSKEASMVKGLAYDKIRDMDFCQLVVDELQSSAIKWQGHESTDEQQASIGEQQLKETPLLQSIPLDLFHIPKNPLRNQPFKHLDAETSNVIAEADAPDLETSAATISETSADMLAESLDPNDCKTSTGSDDAGCDVPIVATTVGEPSTAVGPNDGQTLEDGQHIEETTQTGPSELMFEESGDAKPKEMLVIMEGPCAISDQNANDALIKGTEEKNELAPTGDNTADEQEETNVVSCHHDEQKQILKVLIKFLMMGIISLMIMSMKKYASTVPDHVSLGQDPSSRECMEKFRNRKFIQYGDTEVTIGELADSFEDGAPIKTNIMTIMVDVARSIMTNTKRLIVPFMAVRNNDGNVNTRKLGNLIKAINPVDDSLLLDRYEIIKIPCFEEGDKNDHVGHYFVMSVNLRRKRFELLDSLGGEGAEQHFLNTADVFKEIWKEAYKQSKGKLSPENLDDFTYEKPKVIPLQGATKSLFHIRQDDILFIRKTLLYLILMWEKLEVNFGLIETFHKDDFIKINSGEYKIIRKQTTMKPTMTVIVSLHNVNIPKPKEIDDGKENYPEEQEYVLIGSQEDYIMECLKGRGRGEDDSKKHLDGNCQPEETTKSGKEDRNQQQQKPVVARNNENSSIEYLRAREAKVDDPSRNSKEKGPPKQKVNLVLFTPPNRKSSPPGYKIEKDMYSSLTGSQSFQTPPEDSKSNSVDVEHKDNLNRGKRKLVTPSDVTSTKRPKITARKLCEPVAEYRPKKFKHQVKANKLFNLIVRSNKFVATEVFNAPVMHSVVPDMMVPINGADIKRQFSSGEFLDGGTMDYIIDEMKTTSELYDTRERVLLSQGFIMVSIWK
ncbi:hypothetical protein ACQ4PT_047984 [Festuca glaucescens]